MVVKNINLKRYSNAVTEKIQKLDIQILDMTVGFLMATTICFPNNLSARLNEL
jgi:hypothetical protein